MKGARPTWPRRSSAAGREARAGATAISSKGAGTLTRLRGRQDLAVQGRQRHAHAVHRGGHAASPHRSGRSPRVDRSPCGTSAVTGAVCNVGDAGLSQPAAIAWPRPAIRPWYALFDRRSRDGLVIGWDYMGHSASSSTIGSDGTVKAGLKVAGHKQTLQPGQSVTTQGLVAVVWRRSRQCRQRIARLAVPLPLGLHPRGMVPGDSHVGYWYQRDRLGPAGVTGWAAMAISPASSPRSSERWTSCRHRRRRHLSSRLGLVEPRRRLERPRLRHDQQILAKVWNASDHLCVPLHR